MLYNLLFFGFRGSTWTSSLTLKEIPWEGSSVTVSNTNDFFYRFFGSLWWYKCSISFFRIVFCVKLTSNTFKRLSYQHLPLRRRMPSLIIKTYFQVTVIKCPKILISETISFQMHKLLILISNSSLLSLYLASVHIVLSVWPCVEEVTETKRVADSLKHKWSSVCWPGFVQNRGLRLLRSAMGQQWLLDTDLTGLGNRCFSALILIDLDFIAH